MTSQGRKESMELGIYCYGQFQLGNKESVLLNG